MPPHSTAAPGTVLQLATITYGSRRTSIDDHRWHGAAWCASGGAAGPGGGAAPGVSLGAAAPCVRDPRRRHTPHRGPGAHPVRLHASASAAAGRRPRRGGQMVRPAAPAAPKYSNGQLCLLPPAKRRRGTCVGLHHGPRSARSMAVCMHMHARTCTRSHAHARTHARTHARAHARSHTRTQDYVRPRKTLSVSYIRTATPGMRMSLSSLRSSTAERPAPCTGRATGPAGPS